MEFTQEIVEESEDERCFDDMMTGSDSVPPIELPGADMGRLEEISELVTSCLPSPIRREKLAVAIEGEGYIKKLLNVFRDAIQWTLFCPIIRPRTANIFQAFSLFTCLS